MCKKNFGVMLFFCRLTGSFKFFVNQILSHMNNSNFRKAGNRRNFIGTLATGAAALGLASITPTMQVKANDLPVTTLNPNDPDAWFNKIKGKHRVVFDSTQPHDVFPFAWPKVFLLTNEMTGTPGKDCGVVVVLRHSAMGYAMEDRIWAKYKMGELFKADDPKTKTASLRNPFWKPQPGDFKIPGVGPVEIGINELQDKGVMFCVCNMAMTVYSTVVAGQMNMKPEDVMNDWKSGVLPGIQVVPSGVWALGRAQEHGCQYIFAG